jgi:hypothetical protein
MRQQCPVRHGEWLVEASAYDALDGFIRSLPSRTRATFHRLQDRHACDGQDTVFGCAIGDDLRVTMKLGLMRRLVAYSCGHWQCEDIGMCEAVDVAAKRRPASP